MRNSDSYMSPDAYDYEQSPIEYIDARDTWQGQQQEFFPVPPGYSRVDMSRHTQGEKLKVQKRTKAELLVLVSTCKKWIVAAALVSFGVLSALIAGNMAGANAQNATPQPNDNNPQVTSPSQDDNGGGGGFFQQRQPDQGGSTFGGNNGGFQGPVSGSSVS